MFWAAWLGLLLIALNVISGVIDSPLAYAQPTPSTVLLKGAPSHPNTSSPTAGSTSLTHAASQAGSGAATPYTPQTITHGMQHEAMTPGSLALQVNQATRFVGSDGRLELDIPAGAITAQDLAAAGGTISLRVTQIAPASGSNAGGELSLGTYLLQLVDAHGVLLTHGLRKAITARYHLHANELSLGLAHVHVLVNGSVSPAQLATPGVVKPAAGTAFARIPIRRATRSI